MGFLGFIGDALNDVLGGNSSRKDSQKYNKETMAIQQGYNLENMAIQNQYNIDAFNRENAYNTPLAQQGRLAAAGINPNWSDSGTAIAQQDSASSGSMPSGGSPSGQNTDVLGDIVNLLSVGANIRKTKADAKLAESQTRLNNTQSDANEFALELDREYGSAERSKNLEESDSRIGMNKATENKTTKEAEQVFGLAWADISQKLADIDLKHATTKQVLDLIQPTIKNLFASTDNLLATANRARVETQYIPVYANAAQMSANAAMISAKTGQILAQNDVIRTSLEKLSTYADIAYKDTQTTGQKLINGLNGLNFQIEHQLYKEDIPQNERRELLKNIRKLRSKMDSEIREIESRKDLNEANKQYLRSSTIRNYVESLNELFEPISFLKPPGLSGLQQLK